MRALRVASTTSALAALVLFALTGVAATGCASTEDAAIESAPSGAVVTQAEEEPPAAEAAEDDASGETAGQSNARRSAESYLETAAFSRSGLIKQLEFEGYSSADATYAVDTLDPDWNEQAARSAKSYLEMSGFSRSGLIQQLVFEGYTQEQAAYGVGQAGMADGGASGQQEDASAETAGQSNARRSAESYLETAAFSRSGLIKQLEFEGYSSADATYAVDALDPDWNEQAARAARSYLEMSGFSRAGLIEQLVFEGYTREQAAYGVSQAGL